MKISGSLKWAHTLNLTDPGKALSLDEITMHLTTVLRDKRMLIALDEVWQAEHAAPFKVSGRNCAHIITTPLNNVTLET